MVKLECTSVGIDWSDIQKSCINAMPATGENCGLVVQWACRPLDIFQDAKCTCT